MVRTPGTASGTLRSMTFTLLNLVKGVILIALGLAIGAMGIYVGEVDDAPGAGGLGLLLMAAGVVLGVTALRNRLPKWAGRTAIAVGVVAAFVAALLTRSVMAAVPLFAQPQEVPSVVGTTPLQPYATAVERARELVRAAVLEQNLPGVSVAVGVAGSVVWAEGFGWRDVDTRTPITPKTRFVTGTAATVDAPPAAGLGLSDSGAEPVTAWSPEHVGEPEEDFPGFRILRFAIWQPLGLMASDYPLPGERATFYVPRSDNDPRRGRDLMYMRDLACCADGMAFYSTPSDLVRVALATNIGNVDGTLAGGMVTSLLVRPDRDVVVAVASNIARANTQALAARVGDAFAGLTR